MLALRNVYKYVVKVANYSSQGLPNAIIGRLEFTNSGTAVSQLIANTPEDQTIAEPQANKEIKWTSIGIYTQPASN